MGSKHPNKAIRHAHRNRRFWTDVDQVLSAAEARGLRSIDIYSLRLLQTQSLKEPIEPAPLLPEERPPHPDARTWDGG